MIEGWVTAFGMETAMAPPGRRRSSPRGSPAGGPGDPAVRPLLRGSSAGRGPGGGSRLGPRCRCRAMPSPPRCRAPCSPRPTSRSSSSARTTTSPPCWPLPRSRGAFARWTVIGAHEVCEPHDALCLDAGGGAAAGRGDRARRPGGGAGPDPGRIAADPGDARGDARQGLDLGPPGHSDPDHRARFRLERPRLPLQLGAPLRLPPSRAPGGRVRRGRVRDARSGARRVRRAVRRGGRGRGCAAGKPRRGRRSPPTGPRRAASAISSARPASRAIFRIAFMRIDGKAVAMQMALEWQGRYWLFKIGFDENYRALLAGHAC